MVERAVVIGLKSIDELGYAVKLLLSALPKAEVVLSWRFYSVIPRQKNLKRSK
jgi:hypothetical protein